MLSDNLGHKVSFKNCVVIMTSNVGARLISKGKSLGFIAPETNEKDYAGMKDTVMEEVKRVFNPEFINRLDEILVFRPLTEAEMFQILELMLKRVEKKIAVSGLKMELTDEAKKHLIAVGFDANYGARPLSRAIQRTLEDPLAEDMLTKKVPPGTTVYVDYDEAEKKLTFSQKATAKAAK